MPGGEQFDRRGAKPTVLLWMVSCYTSSIVAA